MKKVLTFALLLFCFSTVFAQNQTDSIVVKKVIGTVFKQNGKILTPKQLIYVMQSDPEASKEMKIAKSNYTVNAVFGFIGGALVGWPLGTALAGGDPDWVLAGIGDGFIGVSIPFASAYVKHAKNAVKIHNNGFKATSTKIDYRLGLTCNGLSLKLTF